MITVDSGPFTAALLYLHDRTKVISTSATNTKDADKVKEASFAEHVE